MSEHSRVEAILGLRKRTARRSRDGRCGPIYGYAICREALEAVNWDEDRAVEWLLVHGPPQRLGQT